MIAKQQPKQQPKSSFVPSTMIHKTSDDLLFSDFLLYAFTSLIYKAHLLTAEKIEITVEQFNLFKQLNN